MAERDIFRRAPHVFVVENDRDSSARIVDVVTSGGISSKSFRCAREFLDFYHPSYHACMVMGIRLPLMSGLELQDELRTQQMCPPIIFVTAYADVTIAARAMKNGAADIIEKPFRDQRLLDSVYAGIARDAELRRVRAEQLDLQARIAGMTTRERQVMDLLLQGKNRHVIAEHCRMSLKTVDYRRAKIMKKMGAKTLIELLIKVNKATVSYH